MAQPREYDKDIDDAEKASLDSDDYDETPPNDIVAFNELRSCADLLRMYKAGQLEIKPEFQRDVVWPKTAQTRFIDSLVKQLPIPSMCISLDYNTGRRLMIDGLQRIWSIICFLNDEDYKLSRLMDIDPRITGRTAKSIKEKNADIYDRVENLTIPITVLRCDYKKKSHMEYLFTIFHRLNTGGNRLSNQEIRNCIYQGRFNDALKDLAKNAKFRRIFGLEADESYRYQYEEFILRVFAMESRYTNYNGKLSKFLNDYMEEQKDADEAYVDSRKVIFERVIDLIYHRVLSKKRLPQISRTTIEALFVGVLRNIACLEAAAKQDLSQLFDDIRKDDRFSVANLKEGLSHTDKVQGRLDRAIEIARGYCDGN